MLIEKIDEQLLAEIQDALYGEHNQLVANWDGEYIDLEYDELDDTLRSQIFSDFLNIPLHMLMDLITQHFPFVKEKDIFPDPYSDVIISENDGSKEVQLRVYADCFNLDRGKLNEVELKQFDKLCEELTQLYEDLDIDTTLYITHVPLEEVPEDYYTYGDEVDDYEDEHDFVLIEF